MLPISSYRCNAVSKILKQGIKSRKTTETVSTESTGKLKVKSIITRSSCLRLPFGAVDILHGSEVDDGKIEAKTAAKPEETRLHDTQIKSCLLLLVRALTKKRKRNTSSKKHKAEVANRTLIELLTVCILWNRLVLDGIWGYKLAFLGSCPTELLMLAFYSETCERRSCMRFAVISELLEAFEWQDRMEVCFGFFSSSLQRVVIKFFDILSVYCD